MEKVSIKIEIINILENPVLRTSILSIEVMASSIIIATNWGVASAEKKTIDAWLPLADHGTLQKGAASKFFTGTSSLGKDPRARRDGPPCWYYQYVFVDLPRPVVAAGIQGWSTSLRVGKTVFTLVLAFGRRRQNPKYPIQSEGELTAMFSDWGKVVPPAVPVVV
jgi:hypothetical protein